MCRRPFAQVDLAIDIDADKQGPVLQDTLYGVFYEDINYAGDGGLYAELIQNRSFVRSIVVLLL